MPKNYSKPAIYVTPPIPVAMCKDQCNGKSGAYDVKTTTVIGKKVA